MQTLDDVLAIDGLKLPEVQKDDSFEFERATSAPCLRDSSEPIRTSNSVRNGTLEPVISKRETGGRFLGALDSVSGSISEVRKAINALDSMRLGLNGHHWSKVKQAIVIGGREKPSGSKSTDFTLPDDHSLRGDVDAKKFPHSKPFRMVFKQLTRVDTKSDMKSVTSDSDSYVRTHIPSLIEDPLLIKISKKNRNIGKFSSQPDSIPEAVCFEIRGTGLTHQDVKLQIEKVLKTCPEVQIMTIQFIHRALVNDQKDMNNRWIITTNSVGGRNRLAGTSLHFGGTAVKLLAYDDVVNTEYQQFVRMRNFVSMMDTRNILK